MINSKPKYSINYTALFTSKVIADFKPENDQFSAKILYNYTALFLSKRKFNCRP